MVRYIKTTAVIGQIQKINSGDWSISFKYVHIGTGSVIELNFLSVIVINFIYIYELKSDVKSIVKSASDVK